MDLGGLGVQNPMILGWAMKMRWILIKKTQPENPLADIISISVPREAAAMFKVSICSSLGNGANILFWTDKWINGRSLEGLLPAVMPFVRR